MLINLDAFENVVDFSSFFFFFLNVGLLKFFCQYQRAFHNGEKMYP